MTIAENWWANVDRSDSATGRQLERAATHSMSGHRSGYLATRLTESTEVIRYYESFALSIQFDVKPYSLGVM